MAAIVRILSCLLLAPLALAAADSTEVVRLSEPVTVTEAYEEFGAPVTSADSALSLAEIVDDADDYLGKDVTVSTRIAQVCRKKGCFFIAREGDVVARITFRDYGFFIPTDSSGKQVTLNGSFERRELSPGQARHYREDLGEKPGNDTAAPAGGVEYHIVATAVRIPKG